MIQKHTKTIFTWLLAACCTGTLSAQYTPHPAIATQFNFVSPVSFPLFLSANYGEMRGNHFHSGVDIKTQGVIGKPIRAIADGTIVRIVVSPSGFGKALYMNHPNGTTSVYGHLERFNEEIEQYIHEIQYGRKSFSVDIAPPAGRFLFKQGEQIALSGNRGSSGGPHLHLEVRETDSQRPLNLLTRGMLQVADTIAPRPVVLYYIEVDTVQGVPIHTVRQKRTLRRLRAGHYAPMDTAALLLSPTGYFALDAEEKKNSMANPLGLYSIEVLYDDVPAFGMNLDRIGFEVGRYCYAAALYPQARSSRNGVYRLCKLPNNRLPIYTKQRANGILTLKDDQRHNVRILLQDDCGNASALAFTVRRGLPPREKLPEGIPVDWTTDFHYRKEGLSLFLPRRSLYESILLQLHTEAQTSDAYSPLYVIHTDDVPVQGAMTITLEASGVPEHLRKKALLGALTRGGGKRAAGGEWKDGHIAIETYSFGAYYVTVDTIAPQIIPQLKEHDDFSTRKSLSVHITDDFSGVASYHATIDGVWALFEEDAKSATFTHYFDDTRWPTGTTHTLVMTAYDGKGNKTTYTGSYKR